MTADELRAAHPRRAGIAWALERAYPLPGDDKEARDERHLLRRETIREAVRGER